MTVRAIAKLLGVHRSTVNRWVKEGCPCVEVGSGGRGHATELYAGAVQRWLVEQRVPLLVQQPDRDVFGLMGTALYDCLKRDGLMGQTLPAERMAWLIFKRLHLNIKKIEPQRWQDIPEDLARACAHYLHSVQEGERLQRR